MCNNQTMMKRTRKVLKFFVGLNFLGLFIVGFTAFTNVYNIEIPFVWSKLRDVQSSTLKSYHHKHIYNESLPDVRNLTFKSHHSKHLHDKLLSDAKTHDVNSSPNGTNLTHHVIPSARGGHASRTQRRVTQITFLKVHKAGSTTVQNLLFRFGLRYNLRIALPKGGNYAFAMNNIIPLQKNETYNIFACHSSYNKPFFDRLIPGSVKIGIIREPVERIVSAAFYYRDIIPRKRLKIIPQANFIHNLITNPDKYDNVRFSETRDSMGRDFGFWVKLKYNDTQKINAYLRHLNSEFRLVMLVERFEESLIMLKRYLNWSFLDVIYLKSNSNEHKPIVLNKTEEATVRKTNFLDFAIYEYFTKVFEEKLKAMKDDFSSEVEYFKVLLSKVSTFCSDDSLQNNDKLLIDKSRWEDKFYVPAEECKWMKTGELSFIDILKERYGYGE